ncbi:hypothetical protein V6N12_016486 [Hibiscus sabdariffa]|uniref:Uncharacterized protein n=1 Tax=Hibiscus sabdariffa TaxID=183260 RepID=A0ABR2CE62_9ROSI
MEQHETNAQLPTNKDINKAETAKPTAMADNAKPTNSKTGKGNKININITNITPRIIQTDCGFPRFCLGCLGQLVILHPPHIVIFDIA